MSVEQTTTPFDYEDPKNYGEQHIDDAIFNKGEVAPAQEQVAPAQEQVAPAQEQVAPAQEQEQAGQGSAPNSVDVQIGDNSQNVTNIQTNIPQGSVGSAILDGKRYVVVEADKYQPMSGGRKSKKRATKRSARKSSKRRKSGRKGRR